MNILKEKIKYIYMGAKEGTKANIKSLCEHTGVYEIYNFYIII